MGMDLAEIKSLIEEQGRNWEEFKRTNDERLKKLAKGEAVGELEEKLNKLNERLAEVDALKGQLEKVQTKLQRPGAGGVQTAEAAEHKQRFGQYLRKGHDDGLRELEQKAVIGTSDPDGGYLMGTEMESAVDRVLAQEVAMRRLATVRTIGGRSYKKAVTVGGASYGWDGESGEGGESDTPSLKELEFVPGKIYAEPLATQDSLDDAVLDLESWLSDEVSISFAEGEGAAFISGNGINKPRGILSHNTIANASYAWGSLGFITSGNASSFAASNPSDKLIDVVHALKRGYRNNASWLMNDLTLAAIRKFKDSQNNYLWTPGLQAGVASTLLGYQVENDDNMPDVGANEFPIAFGDFRRGYLIVDRRGMSVLRDPFTKKGWVKFYTTRRVGGGIQNYEAIKLLKIAA